MIFPKFCFKLQNSLTIASQINEEKVRESNMDKKRKPEKSRLPILSIILQFEYAINYINSVNYNTNYSITIIY